MICKYFDVRACKESSGIQCFAEVAVITAQDVDS